VTENLRLAWGYRELPSANDANEVIHTQDRHLHEAVAAGDGTHADALKAMKGRWKRPWSAMAWYRQVKRDFAELPDT
jgi:hypothetical protein